LDCISLWADPIYLGAYPAQAYELFGESMPKFTEQEAKVVSRSLEFMAANIYSGYKVSRGNDGQPLRHEKEPGNAVACLPWLELEEDALYWAARFHSERYGKLPFMVSENGFCGTDWVARDGKVHDPQRIDYSARYLSGLRRAAREGIPVAGYFYWSLMDNFEWAEGYRPRFGLIYIDFQNGKRTLKDSASWYREVITTRGGCL